MQRKYSIGLILIAVYAVVLFTVPSLVFDKSVTPFLASITLVMVVVYVLLGLEVVYGTSTNETLGGDNNNDIHQVRVFANPENVSEIADGTKEYIIGPNNVEHIQLRDTFYYSIVSEAVLHKNGSGSLKAYNQQICIHLHALFFFVLLKRWMAFLSG